MTGQKFSTISDKLLLEEVSHVPVLLGQEIRSSHNKSHLRTQTLERLAELGTDWSAAKNQHFFRLRRDIENGVTCVVRH
jgi:hypothetical protein